MAEKKKLIRVPAIPGVTFIDWNGADGRARAAIVRRPVAPEVMQVIYRRLRSTARLDLAETKRRKVFAFVCAEGDRVDR